MGQLLGAAVIRGQSVPRHLSTHLSPAHPLRSPWTDIGRANVWRRLPCLGSQVEGPGAEDLLEGLTTANLPADTHKSKLMYSNFDILLVPFRTQLYRSTPPQVRGAMCATLRRARAHQILRGAPNAIHASPLCGMQAPTPLWHAGTHPSVACSTHPSVACRHSPLCDIHDASMHASVIHAWLPGSRPQVHDQRLWLGGLRGHRLQTRRRRLLRGRRPRQPPD